VMPTLKVLALPLLVILYVATFGFLWITNDQQTQMGQFTREMVSVLMASGMVALVTSSVFMLQARET
jgi:EamA domain-containing membrane protein RarD